MLLVTICILVINFICTPSNADASATVYIKPKNTANPDCPVSYPCVTLDRFALQLLPNLSNTNSLSVIIMNGVHNLSVALDFIHIRHVAIDRVDAVENSRENRASIRLLASNITVSDVAVLELKNVVFVGDGKSAIITRKDSSTFSIAIEHVHMTGVILRVLPLSGHVTFDMNVVKSIFEMCRIEVVICMYVTYEPKLTRSVLTHSVVDIKRTRFLTIRQRQHSSLVVYSPQYYESQTVITKLDDVTFMHLNDSIEVLPSLQQSYFCDGSLFLPERPSDVHMISDEAVLIVTNSNFGGNFGTAIYAENSQINISNCTFSGYTRCALVFSDSMELKLYLDSVAVLNNTAKEGEQGAVGLLVSSSGFIELKNCQFQGNTDLSGNSQIVQLNEAGDAEIQDSRFTNNNGTALSVKGTSLIISGSVTFEGNTAYRGGALFISSILQTLIFLAEDAAIDFVNNSAKGFGGAMYIDYPISHVQWESDPNKNIWCFYGPRNDNPSFKNVTFNFWNNSAGKGGDHIYGNSIQNYCKFNIESLSDVWRRVFHIHPNSSNSLSPVSSEAMRVCLCDKNGRPLCDEESGIFSSDLSVYPGEEFSIAVVAVGAEFGTTIGEVYAELLPHESTSISGSFGDETEHIQMVTSNDHCTALHYSLHSRNTHEILYLTTTQETLNYYPGVDKIIDAINKYKNTDVIPISLLTTPVFVKVTMLLPCPPGFALKGNPPYCDCYPQLLMKNVTCMILNGTGYILRWGTNWVGARRNGRVLFGGHCDNCMQQGVLVDLANNSDIQCKFNHSGILCGGCKEGYSISIGSSKCLYCPNNHGVALLIFFVLAGPLLYVFIASLDITVTNGSINGFLFYANVVWIYHTVLLSDEMSRQSTKGIAKAEDVFRIFIAWMNLDFGAVTCFVDGLDNYTKSLLQYIFPAYLWIISYIVVLTYRYTNIQQRFPLCSRLLGKPTDVLVTFLLLSYTKLMRNIKRAFRFTILTSYPDNSTEFVWALDGNVPYLKGKHVVLFLIALSALIASLVFSFYLLIVGLKSAKCKWCKCGRERFRRQSSHFQCSQSDHEEDPAINNPSTKATCIIACMSKTIRQCKKIISSLHMPLPLYDALYAPFNATHKYWLGLMLIVRIILLVVFTGTYGLTSKLNPFILFLVSTLLLVYVASNRIYKNRSVQALESLSLGNLVFFSGGIMYAKFADSPALMSAIACASIGIAFLQFLGIVVSKALTLSCCNKIKGIFVRGNVNEAANAHVHVPIQQSGVSRECLVDPSGWREPLLNDDSCGDIDGDDDECDPLLGNNDNMQPDKKYNALACLLCCSHK